MEIQIRRWKCISKLEGCCCVILEVVRLSAMQASLMTVGDAVLQQSHHYLGTQTVKNLATANA